MHLDLDGLSANEIAAAKAKATEGHMVTYLIGLLNTTQQPLLQRPQQSSRENYLKHHGRCREMMMVYVPHRKMARLRLQKRI
jgi:peptidyl-dipeptidase Dcp